MQSAVERSAHHVGLQQGAQESPPPRVVGQVTIGAPQFAELLFEEKEQKRNRFKYCKHSDYENPVIDVNLFGTVQEVGALGVVRVLTQILQILLPLVP